MNACKAVTFVIAELIKQLLTCFQVSTVVVRLQLLKSCCYSYLKLMVGN